MRKETTSDPLSVAFAEFWEVLFPKVEELSAIPKVIERIKWWTGGQPVMTAALCEHVVVHAAQITESDAMNIVDRVVEQELTKRWEMSAAAAHLKQISAVLLDYDKRDILLLLYMQLLQRKALPLDGSDAQGTLLHSGLAAKHKGQLVVGCLLYAKVFDLNWIESQLPGITRPVTIVNGKSAASTTRPSFAASLYSKLAIAACGLVIAGGAVSTYLRESGNKAMATQDISAIAEESEPVSEKRLAQSSTTQRQVSDTITSAATSERDLFDMGITHATNGRWLPMVREFCRLPKSSTYYMPAEKQMEKWVKLYREDIQIAQDTFVEESSASCNLVGEALSANLSSQ
ncbi:MAG: hypothetical protein AAFR58_05490 [Cyanobacteria bacterium J06627_28]